MRTGDTKIFLDKPTLYRMLNLRKTGLTVTTLALMFDCDHSSIRAQCDRYGITPQNEVYGIERIIAQVIPVHQVTPQYKVVNGERLNKGHSYAEYLKIAGIKYPHRNSYLYI